MEECLRKGPVGDEGSVVVPRLNERVLLDMTV